MVAIHFKDGSVLRYDAENYLPLKVNENDDVCVLEYINEHGIHKARHIFMKDAVKYIDFGRDVYKG